MAWNKFLDKHETRLTADQNYLAQIAAEVCRSRVAKPKQVKMKQFILEFKDPVANVPQGVEDKMSKSKSVWFGALGLNKPKNN
ncbi:MAG: hypothetical protein Unbinned3891contig1000_89 [Prokaryotic dsDNA virus sp.]|nr:MAG: hypothetical protein Unbinned3891contig1000_89 [Prokaryotic dsDNA virus sp.]|tara:strand:- start:41751 stop:41999 length:249 start_codon:yes stop_codon:yes gene_type:complete